MDRARDSFNNRPHSSFGNASGAQNNLFSSTSNFMMKNQSSNYTRDSGGFTTGKFIVDCSKFYEKINNFEEVWIMKQMIYQISYFTKT